MDEVLTLQKLKDMPEGIFAQGVISDDVNGVVIAGTGNSIKWVAVRGHIHDWAIYTDNPYSPQHSFEAVASWGNKLHNRGNVEKLVPCDEEALEMYRD